MSDTPSPISWRSRGQQELFDGNSYYEHGREFPWLDPEQLSDDELAETWRTGPRWTTNDGWSATAANDT